MRNIIKITDFNAPELDVYARLSEVQLLRINEPNVGIFIAESPKVIERAFHSGYEPISFLVEEKHIETEAKEILTRYNNVPVYTSTFDVLTRLTGFQLTRGMLCAMKRMVLPTVETVCKNAHRIAVLENITNPTNIGAIFRSAAALNVDAILLTPACSDPLYRRAARVSMGCVFQIPWTFLTPCLSPDGTHTNYVNFLQDLGFKTAALALTDNSVSIDNASLMQEEKLAIILGNEGNGLSSDTILSCDYTVKIPMKCGVDSLNVAAASAVAFWQLRYKDF